MSLEDATPELTHREKLALRVLAVMYRLINPSGYSHKVDHDLNFIFTGKEKG